jgi:hypothetical protein
MRAIRTEAPPGAIVSGKKLPAMETEVNAEECPGAARGFSPGVYELTRKEA